MGTRTLSNPPLRELVIDIQVSTAPGFDSSVFKEASEELSSEYPIVEPQYLLHGQFGFKGGDFDGIQQKQTLLGYIYKSKSKKNLIQFRSNGFTINKIKPYSSWEAELEKVKRFWPLYKELASPLIINRIAVRAINDIVFPVGLSTPDKLLRYHPRTPKVKGGVTINSYVRRHQLSVRGGYTVNLLFAYEGKRTDRDITFLLDIDIFKKDSFNNEESAIWEQFEEMNQLKNEIFINSLTKKGLEVFK